MVAKTLKATVVLVLLSAIMAAGAYAGKYNAYTCRTPTGAVSSAEDWSGAVAEGSAADSYAIDSCPEGGALIAALGEKTTHAADVDKVTWTFTTPSFASLVSTTLWRASQLYYRSGENATYQAWMSGPTEPKVFDECIASNGCSGQGVVGTPLSSSNRVAVPSVNLGAHLYTNVSCFAGGSGNQCGNGFGNPFGYADAEYLYSADLVLEQTEIPTAGAPSGPLVSETPIHGTSDIIFTATDPGAGIFKAVFNVDGVVVQEDIINENEGKCREVSGAENGLPAFAYVQPCPKSVSADVGLNTTKLTNGHHHVIVSVTDAAGNSAFVLDREVEIENKTPPVFLWRVGGIELGSGASKEFTAKAAPAGAKKTFVLKGKVGTVEAKLESSKLKAATGAVITGGKPGTGSATLTLEEVKVAKPEKCEVKGNKIITKHLRSEIVEGATEKSKVKEGTEQTALLLGPTEGNIFATFEFVGSACSLKGTTATLEGETVAEVSPQKEEVETEHLKITKTTKKDYKTSTGGFASAELTLSGKAATLEGEAEMTLTTKERFGAF